jgi:putative membrane protein
MKRTFVTLAALTLAFAADAQTDKARQQDFATRAATANMFEMEAANVEMQRGNAADAKGFANDMLTDHGQAGPLLEGAAKKEGVTLPAMLDDEHKKKIEALQHTDASDTDQAYLSTQLTAHQEAVDLFVQYSKQGPDGDLKNVANNLIPTLRAHLVRVQGLTSK